MLLGLCHHGLCLILGKVLFGMFLLSLLLVNEVLPTTMSATMTTSKLMSVLMSLPVFMSMFMSMSVLMSVFVVMVLRMAQYISHGLSVLLHHYQVPICHRIAHCGVSYVMVPCSVLVAELPFLRRAVSGIAA